MSIMPDVIRLFLHIRSGSFCAPLPNPTAKVLLFSQPCKFLTLKNVLKRSLGFFTLPFFVLYTGFSV
jgi:hypothetical protein